MATGINKNGGIVNVQDRVSIVAKVVSYTGSGQQATVTVQAPFDAGTFVIQGNDCYAVLQFADASHTVDSLCGCEYGAKNDDITVIGLVTAIAAAPFGKNALLTVQLANSGNSIVTAAGNCSSDNV